MIEQESAPTRPRNQNRVRDNNKKAQMSVPQTLSKEPEIVRLKNRNYDPRIFETMITDRVVDEFWSNKVGVSRACNIILIGDPGVGKTTVALDIVCDIKAAEYVQKTIDNGDIIEVTDEVDKSESPRALFISAEMNDIDMYEYMERYPKFGDVDILFLGDQEDENPKLVIEHILKKGYDIVLGDSFVEIQDEVREACGMSAKQSEKWIIDLMKFHNKGNNDRNLYTSFIMIQQMTKGGKFVGSNKLKHNTTAMLELRFDGNSEASPRYMEFSKNRRGKVNKRLYFNFDKPEHVNYMADKWHQEEENRIRLKNELEILAHESDDFESLLELDGQEQLENGTDSEEDIKVMEENADFDPLFEQAARLIFQEQMASTSFIQKSMRIGYNRAKKIMNKLQTCGIVGQDKGAKPREIIIESEDKLEDLLIRLAETVETSKE